MLRIDELKIAELKEQGNQLFQKSHYEKALEKYNEILKINEHHEPALLNKALTCKRLGQYEEALNTLDKLLKVNPKNSKGLYQKAWILQRQEKYRKPDFFIMKLFPSIPNQLIRKLGYLNANSKWMRKLFLQSQI